MNRSSGLTLLEVAVATPIAAVVLSLAGVVVHSSTQAAAESLSDAQEFARIDDSLGRIESILTSASGGSLEKHYFAQDRPTSFREEAFTTDLVLMALGPASEGDVVNALFFRTPSLAGGGTEPADHKAPKCLFLAVSGVEDRYKVCYFDGESTVTLLDNLVDLSIVIEPNSLRLVLEVPDDSELTARAASRPQSFSIENDQGNEDDSVTFGTIVPTRKFERLVLLRLP